MQRSAFDAAGFTTGVRELAQSLGAAVVGNPELQRGVVSLLSRQDEDVRVRWTTLPEFGVVTALLSLIHERRRSELLVSRFTTFVNAADTPYPKKRYRLPTILSPEEVAQLIDAAPTPFYRTILMTLYGTGVRRTELTRLKVSDIDSRRMVVHIQDGKGPHPPLRLPRQPQARRPAATVLRRSPRHSTEKRIANVDRSYTAPAVALSQVRRTDGRRRTIHSGTTPTPFSTTPGHGCMKSLAHTPRCRRASERLAELCLRYTQTSSSCPRLGSLRPSTRLCSGAPAPPLLALTTPANFYTPRSLHSICISPASAAPAASF